MVTTNEDIISVQQFDVSAESMGLDTSVSGTLFLSGLDGTPERAQIVAQVTVDPDDWGGVMFTIPREWEITGITSSYPQEEPAVKPEEYLTVWGSNDVEYVTRYEYNKMIEIGTNRYTPTGGGTGTVIIQLKAYPSVLETKDFGYFTIGAGSSNAAGVRSIFPVYTTIEIPY